tara:strand:- start:409 stop:927 length:519 start_codon:yes stop_codon:yes gene_type:complete
MVNQIQKPEYSITADQQARIIQSQKIGAKVSSIMSKAVNQIIDEITNQDEDIEKSFDYILSGLVQTFYYQKQNRDKWNMGIHSKLKNLERMSKEEINRLDLIKEMDKKISNTIVINFVKPIIEKLSKDYYNHTKSTWISFSKDTGDSNSSVVQKNKFDAGMIDYIMDLEQRI